MNYTYKQIWLINLPVMMSVLMEQLINITDAVFLGHVGEVELGASALAGICYLILYVIGSGFGMGLQVIIARLNGERDDKGVVGIFSTGLYFLSALALMIIIVAQLLIPPVLHLIINAQDIYEASRGFLKWRIFGLLFSYIIIAFRSYYVGVTKTRFLTICSVVMVIVNIILDYSLIFGKFGMPRMGIEGAAIGSTIAEMIAVIMFFVYYCKTKKGIRFYRIQDMNQMITNLHRILQISVWTMLQSFISLSSWFIFFLVIEHKGEEQLAVANIIRSISNIPFMLLQAFAITGSSLVSNLIGEGDEENVLYLCRKVMIISFISCLPIFIIGFAWPDLYIKIYTDNTQLMDNSVSALYVMQSAYVFTIPAFIYYCAISGTGNTQITLLIGVVSIILYLVYVLILARFTSSVYVLWTAEILYSLLIFSISYWYMRSGRWKFKRI